MLGEKVGQPPGGRRHHAEFPSFRQARAVGENKLHMLGELGFRDDAFIAGERMVAGEGDDDGVAIEELGAEGLVVGWLEGARRSSAASTPI